MKQQKPPADQQQSQGNTLKGFPWWFYLLLAIFCYLLLKYLPPTILGDTPEYGNLYSLLDTIAPIMAIGFLLLAANALYKDDPMPQKDVKEEEKNTPSSKS